MIVLIPISRFRIDYQVATGRPYSQFEQFVLRAIHGGAADVTTLRDIFQVHSRLIIEALVTLTQAGWLAVGGSEGQDFMLTAFGRSAVVSNEPPRTRTVRNETTWIVMERVTGGLIPNSEIRFVSGRDLRDIMPRCLKLEEQIRDNKLDESQVQFMLPMLRTEWLHQVRAIDMRARHTHWIPVNVDASDGKIDNLPERWSARLGPIVRERARVWARHVGAEDAALSRPTSQPKQSASGSSVDHDDIPKLPRDAWPVAILPSDLLWTVRDHTSYLAQALRSAQHSVFIASAFLSSQCLDEIRVALIDALQRGVTIDLLWGYGEAQGTKGSTLDWLKKFAYEAKRDNLDGTMRFNSTPSGSHAKLILWDSDLGWEACVGSFNWLSYDQVSHVVDAIPSHYSDLSVRLRHPPLVASLVRSAVALWLGVPSSRLQSTPDRWHRIASRIEADFQRSLDPKNDVVNGVVRLVLDFEHETLLRTWLSLAQNRVVIASHKIGIAGETRLPAAVGRDRGPEFRFLVVYGEASTDENISDRLHDLTMQAGGEFRYQHGTHAKILVSDSMACVGSYNFLSADPFGTAARARELSVVIEGEAIADVIFDRVVDASGL